MRRKKFKLRLTLYVFSLFIIIAVTVLACNSTWKKIKNNIDTKKQLEDEYNKQINKETSLKDEVNRLQDPEYIAKYAREKYLYTKDGEVIIDVSDDSKDE